MEDPIFDAIVVLCNAAEQDGFVSVADALELVLDVYLMERAQLFPPEPVFQSKRAELAEWRSALSEDAPASCQSPPSPPQNGQIQDIPVVGWSATSFPLLKIS